MGSRFGTLPSLLSKFVDLLGACNAGRTCVALFRQRFVDRANHKHHTLARTAGSHQHNAPDLAFEWAQPSTDLDIVTL